jgi:hypothetical protein
VREGRLAEVVEDYVIYHVEQGDAPAADLAGTHAATIARLLRAEERALSAEEVEGTLRGRISYTPDEVAFLDWFGACLFGPAMDDERRVLELANMELVELRFLDARLDRWILQAYGALTRTHHLRYAISPHSRVLAQIARMQADSATLHEATSNAVKLLGDDYLARFYDVAARRFHAAAWDASIQRKIQTLDSIYSKLSDLAGRRRAELLEWIIIAFFALDIVLQLWG